MPISGFPLFWAWLSALICALSLGPSFAHVLEALPRLKVWSPELWREATVFNGQYQLFAWVGAPLDVTAILLPAVLAFLVRRDSAAFMAAAGAALFYALALLLWFLVVAPANAVLATWVPGPIPADFAAVQWRWETGHMAVASAKLVGFALLALSLLLVGRGRTAG
jgi:hypothetical protein